MAAPERPDQGELAAAEAGGAVALGALLRLMRPRQWIKNLRLTTEDTVESGELRVDSGERPVESAAP